MFSDHNLKNIGRKQKFDYVKNMWFRGEIVTWSQAYFVTTDFKKVVSNPFHASSTLVESECIKRKTSAYQNSLKTMIYEFDFTRKYETRSLKRKC